VNDQSTRYMQEQIAKMQAEQAKAFANMNLAGNDDMMKLLELQKT